MMYEFTVLKVFAESFQIVCPHCGAVQRQVNVGGDIFEGVTEIGCDSCGDGFSLSISVGDDL